MLDDDLAEVMRIELRAYKHPWTLGIFRDCLRVGYQCLVYENEEEMLGYAVMSHAVGEAHILNICIRPDAQGHGYGSQLMQEVLEAARRVHTDTLLLEVRPSNQAALSLYHKMGFCEVGVRKDYYPATNGREDALILAINL
jgi:ribosomal-protein-alanine N-acetyltransferase